MAWQWLLDTWVSNVCHVIHLSGADTILLLRVSRQISTNTLHKPDLLLRPCGLNTPHTHPRATEFLFVISGTALEVGFIEENGARYVNNTVFPGQAALFPKVELFVAYSISHLLTLYVRL